MTLYAQWTKNSASTSKTSASKTSSTSLAKTADPTSVVGTITVLAAGAGAMGAGIRKRRS